MNLNLFRGSAVVLALFVAVAHGQAQSIELSMSDDHIVCWGAEPFWSLDHQDNAGEWRSYDSFGDITETVSGSFGVAGGAYEPIALWRVQADGAGGADYVIIAEPAEIEISEADDYSRPTMPVPLHPMAACCVGSAPFRRSK